MTTLHDRYIAALERQGLKRVQARTRKATVLGPRPDGSFYYVGRAGSIRLGKTYGGSLPISDRFKAKLLEETS
jgi:hypothetical protein